MKVLVLWAPILPTDNRQRAVEATSYLNDPRVEHFWDIWSFGIKIYAQQFNYPETEAWDLFVLYDAGIAWKANPPSPTVWMQNRNLPVGRPYRQSELEVEIRRLLR